MSKRSGASAGSHHLGSMPHAIACLTAETLFLARRGGGGLRFMRCRSCGFTFIRVADLQGASPRRTGRTGSGAARYLLTPSIDRCGRPDWRPYVIAIVELAEQRGLR